MKSTSTTRQTPHRTQNNASCGFTLIELLVVVAIISLLASIILASLNTARQRARDARRLSDMHQIVNALELFFADQDHYPGPSQEGVSKRGEFLGDDNGKIEQALAPYLSVVPKDPLHDGKVYFYSYDPVHCTDGPPTAKCLCTNFQPKGAVLAFNKAETQSFKLRKDTSWGWDKNQCNADYNIAFYPPGP